MKNKYCYICMFSDNENKEYYLIELNNKVAINTLGKGYIWGIKKDALIFKSKNIANYYLKDLNNKNAYIKECETQNIKEILNQ